MKRLVSLVLICALMLGTFAFSAFAEGTHTHDACGDACAATAAAVEPKAIQADVCSVCRESTLDIDCAADYVRYETDTHGSCTYKIFYSHIKYTCNNRYCSAYGRSYYSGNTHFCDELHECSRGLYPTCTVSFAT